MIVAKVLLDPESFAPRLYKEISATHVGMTVCGILSHLKERCESRISGLLLIDKVFSHDLSLREVHVGLSPFQRSIQHKIADRFDDWILFTLSDLERVNESTRMGAQFIEVCKDLIGKTRKPVRLNYGWICRTQRLGVCLT